MRTSQEISDLIGKFNDTRQKTFAEFICELLKDKYIEIYLGDSYEEVKTEQVSVSYAAVFCGKIVGAYRECLIVNSFRTTSSAKNAPKSLGNIVFINERSIKALREVDGFGTINDLFIKSGHDSLAIQDIAKKDGANE